MLNARFRALTANSKQFRTERLEASVIAIQRRFMEEAKRKLQEYPPPIPTSNYVRTGHLGEGWHILPSGNSRGGILTTLVNSGNEATRYVHFVQSEEDQALVHQGRWTTIEEAVDREGYGHSLRAMMRGLRT